jgi:hypothetical protein
MATSTTTAAAVRDRAIAVIEALAPSSLIGDPFIEYQNDGDADFELYCESRPDSVMRMFQVRTTALDRKVEVSNGDVELHYLELAVIVAFPKVAFGAGRGALGRDDVIDQDRYDIEKAIGLNGGANFAAPYPDATYRDFVTPTRVNRDKPACDYLEIVLLMSYLRDMT